MIGNNALNAQSRLQPNRQNGKLHYHSINTIGSTPLNAQMAKKASFIRHPKKKESPYFISSCPKRQKQESAIQGTPL
jgi:hypothetical protein